MGEHWAHNAAHITDGMDEEVLFINRLWTGFDSHHPLHHILPTPVNGRQRNTTSCLEFLYDFGAWTRADSWLSRAEMGFRFTRAFTRGADFLCV